MQRVLPRVALLEANLYEAAMNSIIGADVEADKFLSVCSAKEVETMKTALGKFEKALEESSRMWKSLTTEALPFAAEEEDMRLKCKVMSVKWGGARFGPAFGRDPFESWEKTG